MEQRKRKRRSEGAFGVHFDIHADPYRRNHITREKFDPGSLDEFLARVRPDFVQCDTKGHFGLSAYPTEVGSHIEIDSGVDILKTWREITDKYGIGLFAHHSGVFEINAVERHPEWSAMDEEGRSYSVPDTDPPRRYASVFGPYADELMIPQLLEIAEKYGLDGCWIDGDNWCNVLDYSAWAVEAYRRKTGKEPPRSSDSDFHDYVEFIRQGFRDYINRYAARLHERVPDFQVASNWAYSSTMPERPDGEIDFLSGDFFGTDSVGSGRFAGRCMSNHGKPWDLMAWGGMLGSPNVCFNQDRLHMREPIQLCQEAAVVLSVGGGFQWCLRQENGNVPRNWIERAAAVAEFYRARQEYCFRAEHVPQAAVILSTAAAYSDDDPVFSPGKKDIVSAYGTLLAALDNQYSTEILVTYQAMEKDLSPYGALLLPEFTVLEPELREKLIRYAENGGSLIVFGAKNAERFSRQLGITVDKVPQQEDPSDREFIHIVEPDGFFASIAAQCAMVTPIGRDVRVLSRFYYKNLPYRYTADYADDKTWIGATAAPCGKGKISGVYFDLNDYVSGRSAAMRRVLGRVLAEMYPDPDVKVMGSHQVDVSLMTKDGALCLNLTNVGGRTGSAIDRTFDELPPICDLDIELACGHAPREVLIEPGHKSAAYTYAEGKIHMRMEKLPVHKVITVR